LFLDHEADAGKGVGDHCNGQPKRVGGHSLRERERPEICVRSSSCQLAFFIAQQAANLTSVQMPLKQIACFEPSIHGILSAVWSLLDAEVIRAKVYEHVPNGTEHLPKVV